MFTLLSKRAVANGVGSLAFEAVGGSLKLYFNGAQVGYAIDGALPAASGVGVRASAGASLDDYRAGPVAPLALPFADAFTGANSARLADAWRYVAGSFAIQGNQARGSAAVNLAVLNGVSLADGSSQIAPPCRQPASPRSAWWRDTDEYQAQ